MSEHETSNRGRKSTIALEGAAVDRGRRIDTESALGIGLLAIVGSVVVAATAQGLGLTELLGEWRSALVLAVTVLGMLAFVYSFERLRFRRESRRSADGLAARNRARLQALTRWLEDDPRESGPRGSP